MSQALQRIIDIQAINAEYRLAHPNESSPLLQQVVQSGLKMLKTLIGGKNPRYGEDRLITCPQRHTRDMPLEYWSNEELRVAGNQICEAVKKLVAAALGDTSDASDPLPELLVSGNAAIGGDVFGL